MVIVKIKINKQIKNKTLIIKNQPWVRVIVNSDSKNKLINKKVIMFRYSTYLIVVVMYK